MAVWILRPVGRTSAGQGNSKYWGEAIIRAGSERKAREVASRAFVKETATGESYADDPWLQPTLVTAHILTGLEHEAFGRAEIIGPPEALAYLQDGHQ